jgi:hypothetical protein
LDHFDFAGGVGAGVVEGAVVDPATSSSEARIMANNSSTQSVRVKRAIVAIVILAIVIVSLVLLKNKNAPSQEIVLSKDQLPFEMDTRSFWGRRHVSVLFEGKATGLYLHAALTLSDSTGYEVFWYLAAPDRTTLCDGLNVLLTSSSLSPSLVSENAIEVVCLKRRELGEVLPVATIYGNPDISISASPSYSDKDSGVVLVLSQRYYR